MPAPDNCNNYYKYSMVCRAFSAFSRFTKNTYQSGNVETGFQIYPI